MRKGITGCRPPASDHIAMTNASPSRSYNRDERSKLPVKRNTIVIGITFLILATFAWAGWANWMYRKQAAERALASASTAELIPAAPGDVPPGGASLTGKPAPDFTLEDLKGSKVTLSSYK